MQETFLPDPPRNAGTCGNTMSTAKSQVEGTLRPRPMASLLSWLLLHRGQGEVRQEQSKIDALVVVVSLLVVRRQVSKQSAVNQEHLNCD